MLCCGPPCCAALLYPPARGHPETTTVLNDLTVKMEFEMGESVALVGFVENLAGPMDQVQAMINEHRFQSYVGRLGFVEERSGKLAHEAFYDPCLEGATFRLVSMKVAKTVVDPILEILNISKAAAGAGPERSDEIYQDMARLLPVITSRGERS